MSQLSLFGPDPADSHEKPGSDASIKLRLLVTVKAAPNPSSSHGETVCVACVSTMLDRPGWLRLYPINFRELGIAETFAKYDLIEVDAVPARPDPRVESWKPRMHTMVKVDHAPPWNARRQWLDHYIEDSMCALNRAARESTSARSLALHFSYRCWDASCGGHRQGLLDWEFVALQRRLAGLPDEKAVQALTEKFLVMMCGPTREAAFFVGNQVKRPHVFSVLGVYYPPR